MEISARLAAAQQARLHADPDHAARFRVDRRDAAAPWASGPVHEPPCFVLAMEVLDNLPHDKVVWRGGTWRQTRVDTKEDESGKVVATERVDDDAPITDPLTRRLLAETEGLAGYAPPSGNFLVRLLHPRASSREMFLPTGALRLFDALHRALPRHALLAADFDELPEVVIPGRNAPLVASTRRGATVDHNTYLVPRGSADIFFPTDFALAARAHAAGGAAGTGAHHGSWCKTADFMRRWAAPGSTRTRAGYDPLLLDYSNTSFLLAGNPALCAEAL